MCISVLKIAIRLSYSSIGKWGGLLKTAKREIRDYMI